MRAIIGTGYGEYVELEIEDDSDEARAIRGSLAGYSIGGQDA